MAVSEAFCSLTGYSKEALVGRTPAEAGLIADRGAGSKLFAWPDREVATPVGIALRYQDGTVRSVAFSVRLAGSILALAGNYAAVTLGGGHDWVGRRVSELTAGFRGSQRFEIYVTR